MSRTSVKVKNFKLPETEKRPLSNKFTQTIKAKMAAAGPPLGPLLGKYGINIASFCKDFNERTKDYIKGIPLPCLIAVNPDRSYNIKIQKPPALYYLKQAAGIDSCIREEGTVAGKITLKHLYEIAKVKHQDPHSFLQLNTLKEVCEQFITICRNSGIEVVRELNPEDYQEFLKARKEFINNYEECVEAEKQAKLLRA